MELSMCVLNRISKGTGITSQSTPWRRLPCAIEHANYAGSQTLTWIEALKRPPGRCLQPSPKSFPCVQIKVSLVLLSPTSSTGSQTIPGLA
jgi:hypothetical protein